MSAIPVKGFLLIAAGMFFVYLPQLTATLKERTIVATNHIHDAPFDRSVIFIAHHDISQAWGVFLNKPLTDKQRTQLPDDLKDIKHIYFGGVIGFPNVINIAEIKGGGSRVKLEIQPLIEALEADPDILSKIKEQEAAGHIRLYAGYLGWGFLQLDREVYAEKAWSRIHLDRDIIYTADPDEMHKKAINHSLHKWNAPGV